MTPSASFVQSRFSLVVCLKWVCSIGQKVFEDGYCPWLGRDVERRLSVWHGQVGVGSGFEQHFGALLTPRLLDTWRNVQRRFADCATWIIQECGSRNWHTNLKKDNRVLILRFYPQGLVCNSLPLMWTWAPCPKSASTTPDLPASTAKWRAV